MRRFAAVWPAALLIGVPFLLVLVQPDLGTALMIAFGGVTAMYLAGVPKRWFIGVLAAGVALTRSRSIRCTIISASGSRSSSIRKAIRSAAAITSSSRRSRSDRAGSPARASSRGRRATLDYLPEGHTDFVFATMAEEWGLLGGLGIIFAYCIVIGWGMNVAMRAKSRFGRIASAGLTTTIFFYVAINLLMVMGLAPVVGIPLPLVSYGGSSMMTVLICLGLLMAIQRHNRGRSR